LFEAQCNSRLVTGSDHTIELHNSENGDVLKIIPTPNLKRVSRKKLRALCGEDIEVLWGKTLDNITYDLDGDGLAAHFADGTTYQGDLLVGADGPKSKVREVLLGAEKGAVTPVDIVYNMSIVKYSDAEKAMHVISGHPQNSFGYNPNGTFSFIAGRRSASTSHLTYYSLTAPQSKTCPTRIGLKHGLFKWDHHGWESEILV
jgi:2-polyprenyl-6-methoxyphenol hydroxylase-like FAD-dependent oxidoreductase